MKYLNKKTILIYTSILVAGMAMGWLFFGNSNTQAKSSEELVISTKNEVYTCSMHPQIRSNEPGNCPLCGMTLIPVGNEAGEVGSENTVFMSKTAMQLANIRTARVGIGKAQKQLRLTGKVEVDERKTKTQSSHLSGRIEDLFVSFTGEQITKGQLLANIYSPELVTAQQEFLEALKVINESPELYEAARQKLLNWKLSPSEIDKLEGSKQVREVFPIYADINGFVLEQLVQLGDYISKGEGLYKVADLSNVWIMFDVFEKDLPWVKLGNKIEFTTTALPGKKFTGKISYIDPVLHPKTRASKARIEYVNQSGMLKPEQFVTGVILGNSAKDRHEIAIPNTAVMWTGKRSVVYVQSDEQKEGHFEMREVTIGPSLGDSVIIEAGLQEDEIIAINGAFNIDAAAQLEGKPSMMSPQGGAVMTGHNHGKKNEKPKVNEDHSNHKTNSNEKAIPVSFRKQQGSLLVAYLGVKDGLVKDDMDKAKASLEDMQKSLAQIDMALVKGDEHKMWMTQQSTLTQQLDKIKMAENIEELRTYFANLSSSLLELVKYYKPLHSEFDTLYEQHCPMAIGGKGASWLSKEQDVRNPYFGNSMLGCGSSTEIKTNK